MFNTFKRGGLVFGIAAGFGWCLAFAFSVRNPGNIPAIFGLATITLGVTFYFLLVKCEAWLETRIIENQPVRWRIEVNGLDVGEVTDRQYGVMLRDSLRDGSFMVASIKSLTAFIFHSCRFLVVAVPALAFWILYAIAIKSPAEFSGYLHEIAAMDSASQKALMLTLLQLCILAGMPIFFTFALCWSSRNDAQCNRAIADRLRRHFKIAATGAVCLYRAPSWHGPSPIRQ
ncbi:hypothetical protein [Achromobacter xylosoxidans]|uniref:hypothetical protein n=1 Tax=Alcaligenes xylosoxydans xylosoxydans TaxID=85698 RepID=UPI001F1430D4|nr:hypothetical protein [Achromobacter xylosoxidans]